MASSQPAPPEPNPAESTELDREELTARIISGKTIIAFLVLCATGLVLMLIVYIIPFFQAHPSSISTQILQQIGIALFVTGIISIVAGGLIDTTRSRLERQVSAFLQSVVTERLDRIQQDVKTQTTHLEAEVTGKLKDIQEDFSQQTEKLRLEVTRKLEEIQRNIAKQTEDFVNASESLQAMSINSMSRMYKEREGAINDIEQDLADLRLSRIRLIGISLNDFVRDSGVFHGIWKKITSYVRGDMLPPGANQITIQILLIDPSSHGAHLRSGGEQRDSKAVVQSRLAKDVDFTTDSLIELEDAAKGYANSGEKVRFSFEFRLYQLPPMFFLFSTDAASYMQSYFFWRSRDPATPLPLMRYRGNSEIHKGLNDHFDWIWERASISPEIYFKQHQFGVDKGLHQSGVINVFDDPDDAKKRLRSLLENTQTERLYIQGFSLRSFFDGEGDIYWKIKQLAEHSGTEIKVLIINPDSDQAIYRSFREYLLENPNTKMTFEKFKEGTYKTAQLYRDTERTVRWMRKIASPKGKFHVKWYDTAPYCFLFMGDDSVLVEQYHFGKVGPLDGTKILGKDMARFEYARVATDLYDADKPLQAYKLLESHFDFVFDRCAKDIPPEFGSINSDEVP
jgi:hypothetical protein